MIKSIVPVNGFQGVANSGSGVLNLGTGYRLHQVDVFATVAGALADATTIFSRLRVKLGTTTLRDVTPTQAINYSKLFGITPVTGQVPLYMARPWYRLPWQASATSWDLAGQASNLSLEADFLNPGGGAVGIQDTIITRDNGRNVKPAPFTASGKPESFLRVVKMKSETASASGATTVSVTTLDRSFPIKALLMDVSANAISTVEILADGVQVFKATKAENDAILTSHGLAGSNFGFAYVADANHDDGALTADRSLEVRITTSGAATITILNVQEAPMYI